MATPKENLMREVAFDIIDLRVRFSGFNNEPSFEQWDHLFVSFTVNFHDTRDDKGFSISSTMKATNGTETSFPIFQWILKDRFIWGYIDSIEEDWIDGQCDDIEKLGPSEYRFDLNAQQFEKIYNAVEEISSL